MKPKSAGWSLIAALGYGPALFILLIILHINNGGFSFTTHVMCNLAMGSALFRIVFFITTWGMALLHLPFLIGWPTFSRERGGNTKGLLLFRICGLLFTLGFLLFPIFILDEAKMVSYRIHQVIAVFYFLSCTGIALISWFNLRTEEKPKPIFGLISFLWTVASLAYVIPFAVLGPTAPPYPGWVNALNWIFLVFYGPWALLYGLALIGKIDFY